MGQVVLGLVFHNHQPIGNFGWINEEHYEKAYLPMVEALERHPGVRVGLHYTGSLLDWIRMTHPDLLDRIRALAERGQVEVVGGGFYEPVLAVLPCSPNSGTHIACTIATTTGMYSGSAPAITAAIATFSAVMRRRRTGSTPTTSSGASRTAPTNRRTASSVGGTIGSPSVHPFCWNSSFAAPASATS